MRYRIGQEDEFTERQGQPFDRMASDPSELSPDEELKALLKNWEAPDPPRSLDQRVMDSYRGQHSAPFWRRALASSIGVPIPVAAVAILLLLGSGFLSWRSLRTPTGQEVANLLAPQVQVVEVPVVQERTVVRTVYVEKIRVRKAALNQNARRRSNAGAQGNGKPKAQDEGLGGRFFTRADLSGFQPVGQMRIEVIRGSNTNED